MFKKLSTIIIQRDHFPEWAADVGVIRKNSIAYRAFCLVNQFSYRNASLILVQHLENIPLLKEQYSVPIEKIGVLNNWVDIPTATYRKTSLEKR